MYIVITNFVWRSPLLSKEIYFYKITDGLKLYTDSLRDPFMYHLFGSHRRAPFSRILLVARHPFPNTIHSALRDCRDVMIT